MPGEPPTFLTLPLELRREIYSYLLVPAPPTVSGEQPILYRSVYPCWTSQTSSDPQPPPPPSTEPAVPIHPQILRVNTQTYREVSPLFYTHNFFLARPIHLTAQPALHRPAFSHLLSPRALHANLVYPAVGLPRNPAPFPSSPTHRRAARLVRHWHTRLRLDNEAFRFLSRAAVAAAFSGAASLMVELWRGDDPGSWGNGVGGRAAAEALGVFEGVRGLRRFWVVGEVEGLGERYLGWLSGRVKGRVDEVEDGEVEEGEGEGKGVEGEGGGEQYVLGSALDTKSPCTRS